MVEKLLNFSDKRTQHISYKTRVWMLHRQLLDALSQNIYLPYCAWHAILAIIFKFLLDTKEDSNQSKFKLKNTSISRQKHS